MQGAGWPDAVSGGSSVHDDRWQANFGALRDVDQYTVLEQGRRD